MKKIENINWEKECLEGAGWIQEGRAFVRLEKWKADGVEANEQDKFLFRYYNQAIDKLNKRIKVL